MSIYKDCWVMSHFLRDKHLGDTLRERQYEEDSMLDVEQLGVWGLHFVGGIVEGLGPNICR